MPFNPVLYNAAAAGFCAGISSKRLTLLENDYDPIEPSDFLSVVTAAFVFASEVDAIINAASATYPGSVGLLITAGEGGNNTVVPGTAAQANAAESLPGALVFLCKAAWEGRSLPLDANQLPFTAADYQPVANLVVSEFFEFCLHANNS
jgi:hypothetical protein